MQNHTLITHKMQSQPTIQRFNSESQKITLSL